MLEIADEDDEEDEVDPQISLLAMTGRKAGDTIQLTTTISNTTLPVLVDSGSTHCFVSTATTARLGLTPSPRPGMTVGIANSDHVPTSDVCTATPIRIGNELFSVDMYAIPLAGYKLVLDCQWLRTLGPILWDFELKSMPFWRVDHRVKLLGVGTNKTRPLSLLVARDLLKLLLEEFSDVFAEPTGYRLSATSTTIYICYQEVNQWLPGQALPVPPASQG